MTSILLLALPLAFALVSILFPGSQNPTRRLLLPLAAAAHLALVVHLWMRGGDAGDILAAAEPWLYPDALGLLFLTLTSGLFFPISLYAVGDMRRYAEQGAAAGISERVYVAGMCCFLFSMTAVCLAQDMGLIWVAVEATTLATAPLIYYRKSQGALEATWKYLLICSVGIALALLGVFFLAAAAGEAGTVTLRVSGLAAVAPTLNPNLLKAAFIFLLVGYGAKMGLAPMHNWLPDAHSESPSPVSALLSGTLLNGAFLAILRAMGVMESAGLADFSNGLLRLFGLFSMGIAGAFILGQKDYKRLLAYSSVEHMGILAFGAGLGGAGLFAALLHAANHTFAKGCLFLTAGNIMFRYHSKSTLTVSGVRRAMPLNGALWLAGFLAICGLPPFGLFYSEFSILVECFAGGRHGEGALYLFFLAVVFIGMLGVFLAMLRGEPPALAEGEKPESLWMALPGLAAIGVTVILGLGIPGFLSDGLSAATTLLDSSFSAMPGIRP
ncbi:MAG: NADH dehydrogenase FAD-containing subunit [Planctomycetota bacterium]|jgi:hydrogenase-4 component F|nr:NADH dehydrogenase FAD-containing subunit [Planctomycetota bacterium]